MDGFFTLEALLHRCSWPTRVKVWVSTLEADEYGVPQEVAHLVYEGKGKGGTAEDLSKYLSYIVFVVEVYKGALKWEDPYMEISCYAPPTNEEGR